MTIPPEVLDATSLSAIRAAKLIGVLIELTTGAIFAWAIIVAYRLYLRK